MPTYDDSSLFYNSTTPYVGTGGLDLYVSNPRTESEILQPNFVRRRFPYRAPMNSFRFNQDASAFRFDVVKLYSKFQALQVNIDESITTLTSEKIERFPSIGISWGSVNDTLSLTELSLWLDKLNKRLEKLERGYWNA